MSTVDPAGNTWRCRPAGARLSRLLSAVAFGCVLALAAASAACHGPASGSSSAAGSAEFVARAGASQHPINGKVLNMNAAQRKVTLAHEAIPNYMDAMTMEFKVKEGWPFGVMAVGDAMRGTLVVDGARSWIENVTVAKASGTTAATAPRGSWVPADRGTPLPDVALIDQDAHPMRLDRYRGHPLLLAFSYSRCPLPDYCPLTMQQFARIEKTTVNEAALKDLRFLIVTIDPAHDTPEVLRQYGLKYATGDGAARPFARWNLATGAPEDIKRFAGFFGLDYFQEPRSITHSLRTAIVDPAGRVYKVFEGNEWQVDEVLGALRELAATKSTRNGTEASAQTGSR
jgi:protein SCO1/2